MTDKKLPFEEDAKNKDKLADKPKRDKPAGEEDMGDFVGGETPSDND